MQWKRKRQYQPQRVAPILVASGAGRIINGSFSGTYTCRSCSNKAGTDYPTTAVGGWHVAYNANSNFSYEANAFTVGAMAAEDINGTLTAEEIWGIDTKMDDGRPNTGIVHTWPIRCAASTNTAAAEYNLTHTGKCGISFLLDNQNLHYRDALDWTGFLDYSVL